MNLIKYTKLWFLISGATILAGVLAIAFFGLKFGIDFTGGSLIEIGVNNTIAKNQVQPTLKSSSVEYISAIATGQGSVLIKTKTIDENQKNEIIEKLKSGLGEGGGVEERRFETIGPTVSSDLVRKAVISIILASLGIISYIAFAFRQLPQRRQSWIFGITAVIALIHDLLVTVGVFAIAGKLFNWEVDSLFITALLTVMGFSVHDTIVVFDRIRENVRRFAGQEFEEIANTSIVSTLARSLNTSLTILIALATLLALGGFSLRPFVFTLFVGILVGTYSSIFIASPLVVVWQKKTHPNAIAK